MSKPLVIKEKNYANSWSNIFSLLMFFISFFTSYIVVGYDISSAFVKGVFVLIVSNIISKILLLIWRYSIPKEQWLIMVHGAPAIDSRSQKRKALLEAELNQDLEEIYGE